MQAEVSTSVVTNVILYKKRLYLIFTKEPAYYKLLKLTNGWYPKLPSNSSKLLIII